MRVLKYKSNLYMRVVKYKSKGIIQFYFKTFCRFIHLLFNDTQVIICEDIFVILYSHISV